MEVRLCKFRKDYCGREEKDWHRKEKNDEWKESEVVYRARRVQIASKKGCSEVNPRDRTKNTFWKLRAYGKNDGIEIYPKWAQTKAYSN